MLQVRRASERGHADHGWLNTYHTFSFADYYDPQQMGFRSLRVINEDRVAPGQGFGTHGHRDMEIISYVLDGALQHRDSLGHGAVLRPGEFQRITAGTGVRHSEFNPSAGEGVHFYQIWLTPSRPGLPPGYEQRDFPEAEKRGRWRLVAAPDGADGALTINQDARISLTTLSDGEALPYPLAPGRHAWLQVLRGTVELAGHALQAGDGVAVSDEAEVSVRATGPAELMLFDLA